MHAYASDKLGQGRKHFVLDMKLKVGALIYPLDYTSATSGMQFTFKFIIN